MGVPAVVEYQHSTMLKTFLSVNFSKFCTYIMVGGGSGRTGDGKVGGKNQEYTERERKMVTSYAYIFPLL